MDDVVIRASRPEDMAAVADLRWRWSVDEDGADPAVTPERHREAMAAFAREHPDSHRCVVAERDGVVLGMAWLAMNPRPPAPHRPHGRFAAELQTVYVDPALRGRGVAGRLVARLVELADELGAERIVVHSSIVGETLYRRLGFGDARLLLQRPPED
ncbi:GNAT family N-acetyltransferase [Curtobacterium sp. MCSS17_008]|uniref:GNAT family N-acetyltransferase n=1 Tax=Curtobacterium sp. MCSS17_008 TaxID=2175647 RepID=UPI000DAA0B33|nr:GNAT family N-acetyltransferase [Curtobacterium sp. MCSS17_008]PZF59783.1 GNAT family N-acetyltransferase [Curtobacterium sp. MCSS17_008]